MEIQISLVGRYNLIDTIYEDSKSKDKEHLTDIKKKQLTKCIAVH
jgi:hypothetical protein